MEGCCGAIPGDASTPRACPACECDGSRVELITLKALLRPEALARLSQGAHVFCASPACPVVYFGDDGVFRRQDVLVPVYQKEPQGPRTVCYCFDVTDDRILREVEEAGTSPSVERVRAMVREDRCACELRNPQGGCCLGNLVALTRLGRRVGAT
jgi:Zinc binding domain